MCFNTWLEQYVYTIYGALKRKRCIKYFTKALWKFIIAKGYNWKITENHLKNCIATGLYENTGRSHIASEWNYSDVNTDYSDDDLNHYQHIINFNEWDAFWLTNGNWGDLNENEFRGQDRRQDIEAFVWKQIDINSSPQSYDLYEIMLGGEDDNMQSPSVDVYLQEAVEYNGWGGIRR